MSMFHTVPGHGGLTCVPKFSHKIRGATSTRFAWPATRQGGLTSDSGLVPLKLVDTGHVLFAVDQIHSPCAMGFQGE